MTLHSCSWRQEFCQIEISFISDLANERVFLPRPVLRAKLIPNLHSAGVNFDNLTPKKHDLRDLLKDLLSDLVLPLYLAGAWLFETSKLGKRSTQANFGLFQILSSL